MKIICNVFEVVHNIIKLFNFHKTIKGIRYLKENGIRSFYYRVSEIITNKGLRYKRWYVLNTPTKAELKKQKSHCFEYNPKISIIVSLHNAHENFLKEMISSVLNQTYSNLELCIFIEDNIDSKAKANLEKYKTEYQSKIKLIYPNEDKDAAGSIKELVSTSTCDYITLIEQSSLLAPNALFEVIEAINRNTDLDFIYTDEDKTDETDKEFFEPYFKPDFSQDALRSQNYIGNFMVIKKSLFNEIGGIREEFNDSKGYDLALRAVERAKCVFHIPKVLYHLRMHNSLIISNEHEKLEKFENGKRAIQEHINRIGLHGEVTTSKTPGVYQVKYKLCKDFKASIIIPNKDNISYLSKCIESIMKKSTYKNYEIVIVENNSEEQDTFEYYDSLKKYSNVKVLYYKGEFNYPLINDYGVKNCDGDILLFLNNDTEVINSDWIENMLQYIQREDVGGVGAKLYYPDNTIQHAGVALRVGGTAGHIYRGFDKTHLGCNARLTFVQNMSAVTGACLMTKRELYNKVNGMDPIFRVAINDIDFCLKLRELGKLIVWTPFAELYHYESRTRGYDDTKEKKDLFNKESGIFKQKWCKYYENGDPYYNPNFTLESEQLFFKI